MYLFKLCSLLEELSEAKVSEFVGLVFDEYVGWFEIAMNDLLPYQLGEATEELSHYLKYFFFFELFAFHELLEVSVFTKLSDNIETIFRA